MARRNFKKTKEEIIKSIEESMEKVGRYPSPIISPDGMNQYIDNMNQQHASILQIFMDRGVFKCQPLTRIIWLRDPVLINYLVFLPFIVSDIDDMGPDDWFIVSTGKNKDRVEIGELQFNGLAEQDDSKDIRLGYKMTFRPSEAMEFTTVEFENGGYGDEFYEESEEYPC